MDDNPLVIEDDNDYDKLKENYWSSIKIEKETLRMNESELIIKDNPHVGYIWIDDGSCSYFSSLILLNLPNLRFIKIEDVTFDKIPSLSISSKRVLLKYEYRFSSAYYSYYWKRFFH